MSLTLATVAEALIEFILSLLRDPVAAAEFDEDPDAALLHRGLSHATAADVAAVAPVVIERTQVVQVAVPKAVYVRSESHDSHDNPVVREIKQVTTHFQWVDDRDTIVDQSVNQNIWADGDVTQTFDNEATVASGDEAIAAAGDVDVDKTLDQSTTIDADGNVNIGNDTDVSVIEDSLNVDTDEATTDDDSTDTDVDGSFNDDSTTTTVDGSLNQDTDVTTTTDSTVIVDVVDDPSLDADPTVVPADGAAPAEGGEDAPIDEAPAEEAPVEEYAEPASVEAPVDSAAQYAELESDADSTDLYGSTDTVMGDEPAADDQF
ncbi:IniB N-terminal domain-containing protein [Microbacterium sp. P01]|uniref:IniB N-terminal domain-containing protein n=1 Tax=Microbacterium sp. P01 TaxID=3366261 RepID=UPI00366EEC13